MIIDKKKDIYIDVILFVNKLMLDDNLITYDLYKSVEDNILRKKNF